MNLLKLAYLNMTRRKSQTLVIGLIIILTVTSFVIFTTVNYLSSKGLESSREKLGAELIVVPRDTQINIDELLFTGEPSSSYMPQDIYDKIKKMNGIDKLTSQFYTATIEGAACCEPGASMRIVGIDLDSDFIIKNWFDENEVEKLESNEAIVGKNLRIFLGNNLAMLGDVFEIKGRLDSTGTGMDETIFIDMEKAKELSKAKFSEEIWDDGKTPEDYISTILIKIDPGCDVDQLKKDIEKLDENIKVGKVSDSVADLKGQFDGINTLIKYIIGSLIGISFISLLAQYNNMILGRKREIGYLRGLGFSKYDVSKLLLLEVILVSLIFGLIGGLLGGLLIGSTVEILKDIILLSSIELTGEIFLASMFLGILFSLVLGILASINAIHKMYKLNVAQIMSEGGLY